MNLRPSQRILRALMSCAEYHRSSAHIIIFKITAVHFLHLYAARLQGFLSFSFSIGWRRALPYPLRYCGQLQAKPVAVRCPANGAACQWHGFSTDRSGAETCSCKHSGRPTGVSRKKKRPVTASPVDNMKFSAAFPASVTTPWSCGGCVCSVGCGTTEKLYRAIKRIREKPSAI